MMKKESGWELMFVTLEECRWCDGISHHPLYEDDTIHVCSSCGAEWDPIKVKYLPEELGKYDPFEGERFFE